MYNYPYGDNQQINLNWIISEIIALHQRLDPDYTAPTFTQIYPFSETQQLNLDWILTELKALKELAPPPSGLSSDDVLNDSTVSGSTVTDALNALLAAFGNLDSDDIDNASQVTGASVTDALSNLNGAINANESAMAIVANGDTHPAIAANQMVYIKNHATLAEGLYRATAAIPLNNALSGSVTPVSGGGFNALSADNVDSGLYNYGDYTQTLVNKFMGVYKYDITDLETFDASIKSGTVSFVRNRTGYPASYYNYSPGIYFKPTSTESLWVMFGRNTNDIVLKVKNTTWESGWHYISST